MAILFRTFKLLATNDLNFRLSNLLTFSVPDKGHSSNPLCVLDNISTVLLERNTKQCTLVCVFVFIIQNLCYYSPMRKGYRTGSVVWWLAFSPPSVVDRGFELLLGQTKDNNIGICCFSAKHAVLRSNFSDIALQKSN